MEKRGKGRPRRWESAEAFLSDASAYISKCKEEGLFVNIAGFCVFAGITRETFYKQNDYFSDAFKMVNEMLEEAALQSATAGYPPSVLIFYLKNKCGYKDRQEIDSNINANVGLSVEDRALLQRVESRTKQTKKPDEA